MSKKLNFVTLNKYRLFQCYSTQITEMKFALNVYQNSQLRYNNKSGGDTKVENYTTFK